MLLTISRYIELMFDEKSRPGKRTVERWLANDEMPYPVRRLGRRLFVDVPPEDLPDGTTADEPPGE